MADNFALRLYKGKHYKLSDFSSVLKDSLSGFSFQDTELFKDLCQRQLMNANTQSKGLPGVVISETENYQTISRLAIGFGESTVAETGMHLHHIYGFPYITGSAFKGFLRSWLILKYFADPDKDVVPAAEKEYPTVNAEYRALQAEWFCTTFGCPADVDCVEFKDGKPKEDNTKKRSISSQPTALKAMYQKQGKAFEGYQGRLIFFDAYPIAAPQLELDIMTPHYHSYYEGKTPPADWINPKPISFLTVSNTKFQFLFGMKDAAPMVTLPNGTQDIISFLSTELKEALAKQGIGAKTSIGHGRMKPAPEKPKK